MNKNIKFAFFGTPDVARETLEILKENGHLPALVVTSPDKPQGRKMIVTPPPAKVWAIENDIAFIQKFENLPGYDLFIVVAYGKILPEAFIKSPRRGSINIHYSLLPKYRGASPVEAAILSGEKETGVTIQQMEYRLDSGGILAQEKTVIGPDETAPELRKRLIKMGGDMLVELLENIENIKAVPQDESAATYCTKIKKEDGLLDLSEDPVKNYNKYRAYAAWPRTYFMKDGKRFIITKARLSDGKFIVERVIPEGKKETDFNTLR